MIDPKKNEVPLDLSYLKDMSGDSAEFIIEMLDAFKAQTPITMADLAQAIATENWKVASECAHKIKPTFYYVGREDARDHMQEIERNTRELTNLEGIPQAFEQIKDFVKILDQQIDDAKALMKERL